MTGLEALDSDAVLLIVDVQTGLDDPILGERNNPGAETQIERLLATWRRTERPVIHVQHLSLREESPLHASQPGCAIKGGVKPHVGELLIQKHANSAFIGTDLEERLRAAEFDTLVIVGLTTPHCVSTTARMAGNLGFRTVVVADATAAHGVVGHDGRRYSAEEVHAVSLATLHGEFATVVETEDVLGALAKTA